MKEFLHVLLHSLIDTAKLLPVLFIVYFLIEFLEYKNVFRFEKSKLLNGKTSPVVGALFGSVPQCGFSVISSELYSERKISIGALIAVFIATSDEALPLMISNYKAIPSLILLLITKIIFGVLVGYLTMFLHSKLFTSKKAQKEHPDHDVHNDHNEYNEEHEEHLHACCHHDLKENKYNWKHPLIHCLKIFIYIYIINVIFGTIIMFVGENELIKFLNSSKPFQPLLAVLIGLIPNCISSVIMSELYLMGGLSFGSIIAGLSVNAGLGLIILLKENKNKKENLFIISTLILSSLVIGYVLHAIPITLF